MTVKNDDNLDIKFVLFEIIVGMLPIIGLICNASLAQLVIMIVAANFLTVMAVFIYLDNKR